MLPPAPSSRKIVSAVPKCVPYPVLQENTLVLSNFLVVGKRNGRLALMFRQAPFTACHCHDSAADGSEWRSWLRMLCPLTLRMPQDVV